MHWLPPEGAGNVPCSTASEATPGIFLPFVTYVRERSLLGEYPKIENVLLLLKNVSMSYFLIDD